MIRPLVFGKFILLERISVGGMAEVYRAKLINAPHFNRYLAIKRILPNLAADKEFITMFIDEAKITVELNHPNICQIYELGRLEDAHYIVMEYIPGHDLLALQNRYRRQKKIMSVSQACFITAQVAQGLDSAHRAVDSQGQPLQVVHRDVSPQNVLVSYEGLIKVIDFGVAKAASKNSKTQAGVLKGKFGYMSPEQVGGKGVVDHRSDVFALGTLFWELLTGRRLFHGDNEFATLEMVRECKVQPPSELNRLVPAQVEAIVMRALYPDPAYRYQWAGEVVRDLWMFLNSCNPPYTQWHLQNWMCTNFAEDLQNEWEKLPIFQSINKAEDAHRYNEAQLAKAEAEMQAQMAKMREQNKDFEGNLIPELDDIEDGGENTQVFTPEFDFASVKPSEDDAGLPGVPRPDGPPDGPPAEDLSGPEISAAPETPVENPLHYSIYQMDAMYMQPQRNRTGVVLAILIVLVFLAAGGGGAYWWFFLKPQEVPATAAETKASVSIDVHPESEAVAVRLRDDAGAVLASAVGAQAELADLEPGRYILEVDHPDYETETRTVNLSVGASVVRIDMLRKKIVMATVTINVSPEDALLSLSGVVQEGEGAVRTLKLPVGGSYDIGVKRAGYVPFETNLALTGPEEQSVAASLELGVGSITVKSSPKGTLYIKAGEEWDKKGNTPQTLEIEDPTTTTVIEVRKKGYETWTKEITFGDGFEKSFFAALQKKQ